MKTLSAFCLSACALGVYAPLAFAQATGATPAPSTARPVTTIEDAVALALRESPLLKAATATRNAAAARVGIARAETRPTLSANAFVSGGTLPNIVQSPSLPVPTMIMGLPRGGYADQNLMLMYPLYTGGRLTAMIRQAEAMRDTSEAERAAKRQEVALLVRVAYHETLARRAVAAAARAVVTESEERLRADRARGEQGRIPAYFVDQDEADLAAARQTVTDAERDAELSLAALKTAMGLSVSAPLELGETTTAPLLAALVSEMTAGKSVAPDAAPEVVVQALWSRAQKERPELWAQASRVASARSGERAAGAQYRPQVNAFVMGDALRGAGQTGTTGVTYGLAASVPLLDGGSGRARKDEARAMREEQEAEESRTRLAIEQEVNEAYRRATTAEQNVATATAALTSAKAAYKAADARYQAGRSVLSELLGVSAQRIRAETELLRALLERDVTQDQLRRAVGVLLPR